MGILSAKLDELDEAIHDLEDQIAKAGNGNRDEVRKQIDVLRRKCQEGEDKIASYAQNSRLPLMQEFAQMELMYCKAIDRLREASQDSEMSILCAEFAIDAAIQAASRAQLIALTAMDSGGWRKEKGEEP